VIVEEGVIELAVFDGWDGGEGRCGNLGLGDFGLGEGGGGDED
jgi:hypothetical protein